MIVAISVIISNMIFFVMFGWCGCNVGCGGEVVGMLAILVMWHRCGGCGWYNCF